MAIPKDQKKAEEGSLERLIQLTESLTFGNDETDDDICEFNTLSYLHMRDLLKRAGVVKTPKHITEGIEQLRRALKGVGGNEVSLTAVNRFSDGWKARSYMSSGGEHIFRHMHKNDIPRNWIDFFQAVQPEVLTWLVENQKSTGVESDE